MQNGKITIYLYLQLDCNDLVIMWYGGRWFVLFSSAKATCKETSTSADCNFFSIQMKRDLRTDNDPAGCLLEFFVRTSLARSNSGHVPKREIIRLGPRCSNQKSHQVHTFFFSFKIDHGLMENTDLIEASTIFGTQLPPKSLARNYSSHNAGECVTHRVKISSNPFALMWNFLIIASTYFAHIPNLKMIF